MEKVPARKPTTAVVHAQKGDTHVVGVKALRVLLSQDDSCWFAQGLEIDYAAGGTTIDEVQNNFANGLVLTIKEHLKMYGGIKKLLRIAPQEAWEEFVRAPASAIKVFTTVNAFQIQKQLPHTKSSEAPIFPFDEIHFIRADRPSVAAAASA